VTERGRKRSRLVRVDLNEVREGLGLPTHDDRASWEQVRALLRDAVGESTFEIWLEPIELIAMDDGRVLVLDAPDQTASWMAARFGRLLTHCAERTGRGWRLASEPERRALEHQSQQHPGAIRTLRTDQKEAS
jgi:chromosomal replication initiation ATPase DnaA